MNLNLLGISGSLRMKSCNSGLLRAAATRLPVGVTLEIADLLTHPLHAIVLELRIVVGVEIIQTDHCVSIAHQPQNAMGTNEAGRAGDQDFHGRSPSGAMWRRPMPL